MALVQLSDVIVPEYFAEYMALNSMTSTALFQSGVLVGNPLMQARLGMGGDILNIPAWTDLVSPADPGGSDPNLSNDVPTALSTPFPFRDTWRQTEADLRRPGRRLFGVSASAIWVPSAQPTARNQGNLTVSVRFNSDAKQRLR
jgi:hypothetical protein